MTALLRARLRAAARALLGSLVRHLLTAAGTALVARGFVDQGTVDGILPLAVDWGVGALLVLIGIGWGQIRALLVHSRWAAAWTALTADAPADDAAPPAPPAA